MRSTAILTGLLPAAFAAALATTDPADAGVALDWQDIARTAMRESNWSPHEQLRGLTILNIALFDAANGVAGRFSAYALTGEPLAGGSEAAAASEAAFRVLSVFLPDQVQALAARRDDLLARHAGSGDLSASLALGERAAEAVLAARAADGADFGGDYTEPPQAPGVYRRTSDKPMVLPNISAMRPYVLAAPDALLPPPPPSLDSAQFQRDLAEVRESGGLESQTDPEKVMIARLHAGSGAAAWIQIGEGLLSRCDLPVVEEARALALLTLAMSDTLISGMTAKYRYNFWRPITVIHEGGAGFGRPDIAPDTSWAPVLETPRHPEYPCQHCANGSAAQGALEAVFGTGPVHFTFAGDRGLTGDYTSLRAFAEEEAQSRIYGGAHFRWSNVAGSALGAQVAATVVAALAPRAEAAPVTDLSASGCLARQ